MGRSAIWSHSHKKFILHKNVMKCSLLILVPMVNDWEEAVTLKTIVPLAARNGFTVKELSYIAVCPVDISVSAALTRPSTINSDNGFL